MISDKKLQEKIGWSPHPAQQKILDSNSPVKVVCAGRRFGKSQLSAYICLKELLQDDKHIWIVAPTYDLTNKIFDYVVQWIAKSFPSMLSQVSTRTPPKIKTQWGSWIEGKSTENATSLLGEELDLLIIDEASRVPKDVWESALYPTLAKRDGKAFFISTPFGKNWFFAEWTKAKDTNGAFHFTGKDNPYFPIKKYNEAKDKLPQLVFQQEYEAKFLAGAASYFRNINEQIHGEEEGPVNGHIYYIGYDPGRRQDYSVIVVIDQMTHHVVKMDRFNQVDWTLQAKRVIETAHEYNDASILFDRTVLGDVVEEELYREADKYPISITGFIYTNQSKKDLMEKLSIWIERGRITYPNLPVLIDELESFGYEFTPEGRIKLGAPQGSHDDAVNGLALAVYPLSEEPLDEKGSFTQIIQPQARSYK